MEDDFKKRQLTPEENEDAQKEETFEEDLREGDDAIEMEKSEAEKITYGSSLSSMDGDLGDESEDINDLPTELKKPGNRYDPTLSSGKKINTEAKGAKDGIEVKDEDEIGMAYGKDRYTDENEEAEETGE